MFFPLCEVFSVINTSYVVCYITTYATTWTVNVDVQIICSLFIDCVHSSVRLVGSSPREGRVEICYHGMWSTVCINSLFFFIYFVILKPEWFVSSWDIPLEVISCVN